MQIQIIATTVETKPTQKGSYQQLEVTFKNLTYNKTESKKVMSFGANANAFKALADAQPGSVWDVEVTKNAQGYNDWTSVKPSIAGQASEPSNKDKPSTTTARPAYETPEERAQRQVFIIRQSSLGHALTYHSLGTKHTPKLNEVLLTAEEMTSFVLHGLEKDRGPSGFADFPDIPSFDAPEVK